MESASRGDSRGTERLGVVEGSAAEKKALSGGGDAGADGVGRGGGGLVRRRGGEARLEAADGELRRKGEER